MYLAHLVKARQLNDCGATSRCKERMRGAATGLSEAGSCSFDARPAVSRAQLRLAVRTFSLQDEVSPLAAIGWIFLLRIKSEVIPTRRRNPTEDMSEFPQAGSHSVPGMVGRRPALKLRRRKHIL